MDKEATGYWISQVVPAEVTFREIRGHRLALADLGNGETLVATTHFADVDTGLQSQDPEDGVVKDVRSELVTVARASQEQLAELVIEAAELLEAAKVVPAQPGTLLPKLGENLHAMLIAPYLWGGQTPQLKEPDRWTLLLQVVGLNDEEYGFAVEEGVNAFQEAVVAEGIDVLDWTRITG